LNHARPNDFCNYIQRTLASTSGLSSRPRWGLPTDEFPRAASLRPLMRGGEPCVPDRLEDRTPISCEWAEKEHTGRRAEPKAEFTLPRSRFLGAGLGAAQSPKRFICVRSGVLQSLPLSLSEHLVVVSAVSNTELECPSEFRDGGELPLVRLHVCNRTNRSSRSFRTEST